MKIVLIGFRATGKTSVGKELARRLGLPFLDLDEYIVNKVGKSITEIVEEKGWPYFRELEKEALYEMGQRDNLVLALGGGSVMHTDEMDLIKANSSLIWLKAQPQVILLRLEQDEKSCSFRPSLTNKSLEEEVACILAQREPLYQRYADLIIETDHLNTEEVVAKIIEFLRQAGVI
ncbi:shikimate kinase [Thermodesulfatator autotrophicus]|uniref:Shikimate kinase n=1 Tax=Thermodesulfatator autotrophicus TaxID=1795632 RepID=A0A177E621_9BACT|nr:shikimate kinase [Thermodesulfatator autotrophicus]OAG26941.1 shikimate kinase [Thermodesulfatator autotrophicus]